MAKSGFCALLLIIAAFALGQALQAASGLRTPASLWWLYIVCTVALAAVLASAPPWFERHAERALVVAAGVGFACQLVQLATANPGFHVRTSFDAPWSYQAGLVAAAIVGGAGVLFGRQLGRLLPVLLALVFLYLAGWMIRHAPPPFIDVYVFQRDAIQALLAGENPWALRYPDIYARHGITSFYGDGLSVDGKLVFGYPYPPLSLLLAVPGEVFFGDFRYSQATCVALSGVLIAFLCPGRVGNAVAALFLFTPRSLFVIHQGWTEPFVVLGLTATVLCALRAPRVLPYVVGAFLVTKQYTALLVPLLWLLPWRDPSRSAARAVAMAGLLTVPFVLWRPRDFWFAVVELQFHQPLRTDAMSFLSWWAQDGASPLPTAVAFGLALIAMALSWRYLPHTPAGFATGAAFTLLVFFAFNKQAFANYYYFVIGALAVAAASLTAPPGLLRRTARNGAIPADEARS